MKYKPLENAELSLQFYRDKEGTPNFMVTSNLDDNNWPMTGVDLLIFARNFADDGLVDKKHKLEICRLFRKAESILNQK